MSKAYWISTVTAVHDATKFEAYVRLVGPAIQAAGGLLLARGDPAAAFESGTIARTTLIEFASVDAAVAAYHSAAYQEALRVLADGAEREIRIIEAVGQVCRRRVRPGRSSPDAALVRGWPPPPGDPVLP